MKRRRTQVPELIGSPIDAQPADPLEPVAASASAGPDTSWVEALAGAESLSRSAVAPTTETDPAPAPSRPTRAERRAREAVEAARLAQAATDAKAQAKADKAQAKADRAGRRSATTKQGRDDGSNDPGRRERRGTQRAGSDAAADVGLVDPGDDLDLTVYDAMQLAEDHSTVTPLDPTDVGAIDVERALRMIRWAAALIAMAAVIGARGTEGPGLHGAAAAAAIFGGVLIINLITTWTDRRGWATVTALGGEVLDVIGSLGLVYLLNGPLDGSSWMVMLLPIVMGGVRFGASGVLLAWTLGLVGYLAMTITGVLDTGEKQAEAFATGLQHFAFLLAMAVPVAALTQWLQQRWEHQRSLTRAASMRAQRLELIEALARSFIGSPEPKLLANLADAGLRLGFSTVTITLHSDQRSMTVAAVGESRKLPTDDVTIRPALGETLVTHWHPDDDDDVDDELTSVSILLDATGNAIAFHGWSTHDVDEDLARAFGLLGAHASVALQAARMLAALEREAKQDPLTSLLNRRAFDEQIDRKAASRDSVALLLLDVDHFKTINDTYGHQAGDKVLRVIAERLRGATVATGSPLEAAVARIGGDEFAVLLTGAPLEQVADVADRIEASMQEPVALEAGSVPVSFSIGISDASGVWEPRELIASADEATYQAKTHGRNRSCWAPGPVGETPNGPTTEADELRARLTRNGAGAGRPDPLEQIDSDPLITLFQLSMDPSAAPTQPQQRPTS